MGEKEPEEFEEGQVGDVGIVFESVLVAGLGNGVCAIVPSCFNGTGWASGVVKARPVFCRPASSLAMSGLDGEGMTKTKSDNIKIFAFSP